MKMMTLMIISRAQLGVTVFSPVIFPFALCEPCILEYGTLL